MKVFVHLSFSLGINLASTVLAVIRRSTRPLLLTKMGKFTARVSKYL